MKNLLVILTIVFVSSISLADKTKYECVSKNQAQFTIKSKSVTLKNSQGSASFPVILLEKLERAEAARLKQEALEKANLYQITSFEAVWMDLGRSYRGLILINLASLDKSGFLGPDDIEASLNCVLK